MRLLRARLEPLIGRSVRTLRVDRARVACSRRTPAVLLPNGCARRILVWMLLWLLSASLLAFAVLTATGGLSVQRNGCHVVAQLAVGGRGLYFNRTPDGVWWRLRLRRRACGHRGGGGEPPPDSGVREPRRPQGPGPLAGLVELDSPRD
jgi:hypothetical protein